MGQFRDTRRRRRLTDPVDPLLSPPWRDKDAGVDPFYRRCPVCGRPAVPSEDESEVVCDGPCWREFREGLAA